MKNVKTQTPKCFCDIEETKQRNQKFSNAIQKHCKNIGIEVEEVQSFKQISAFRSTNVQTNKKNNFKSSGLEDMENDVSLTDYLSCQNDQRQNSIWDIKLMDIAQDKFQNRIQKIKLPQNARASRQNKNEDIVQISLSNTYLNEDLNIFSFQQKNKTAKQPQSKNTLINKNRSNRQVTSPLQNRKKQSQNSNTRIVNKNLQVVQVQDNSFESIQSDEKIMTKKKYNRCETGNFGVGQKSIKKINSGDSVISNQVTKHIPLITNFVNHVLFDTDCSFLSEIQEEKQFSFYKDKLISQFKVKGNLVMHASRKNTAFKRIFISSDQSSFSQISTFRKGCFQN